MKKNKYIVNITMIIILLLASITMCLLYPTIKDTVYKHTDNKRFINDYAGNHLETYNYLIDMQIKKDQNINLQQYIQDFNDTELTYRADQNFIEDIERTSSQFNNETDFQYYAVDTKTNKIYTNTKDNLATIDSDNILKNKYQWYIQFVYDNDGKLTINYNKDALNHRWSIGKTISSYSYDDEHTLINISNPKNLTITYAVANTLLETSDLSYYIQNNSANMYFQYSVIYIMLIASAIFVITIITPYKYLQELSLFNVFARIKFEILSIFWITTMSFMARLVPSMIYFTSSNEFSNFMNQLGVEHLGKFLNPTLTITFWFIFFALIMLLAYMMRYLFNKGLKAYCRDNTVIGWIITHSHKLLDKVIDFDFNDNTNRVVLKIVIFNFVIITIISFFFVFGLFFSLLYSIVIFIILKKKFEKVQSDYDVLLNASKQLSDGNFDVQIQQDVGIFNPLKDEFSHIKSGFEKAVKEEVKSQKTKTELISNVSHDLKTPLTSIITYIDLLKNIDISNEDKDKYIEILDRNSLRLKHLIEDLFEVSKANSGDIKLNYAQVDIISLIKQVQYECSDKLEEKNLDLRVNFAQEKIICTLDGEKTYRVFENLFMNISKYALPHTRVYIDIIEADSHVEIIFKNISEVEMRFNEKDIVERFVQGDESRNTSGSGLGLAIVKSFTEIQNGQFKIELDGDLFKSILIFKK